MRPIAAALGAFRRAPLLSALSVTTIAFSLFAFGLFALVATNIRHALDQVEDRVEIRAFVVDGTPAEVMAVAAEEIAGYAEVAKVDLVTREQALERARAELGEFRDVFDAGFLPASLDVRLKRGSRDPETVRAIAARLAEMTFVEDIRFGDEWITQLYRLRNIAGIAGASLGLAFAAVAMIIIGATIRMAVLARSKEISIMRLVGATDGFIRRPFLVEGTLKGVMGGALALAMTWTTLRLLAQYLSFETTFFDGRAAVLGVLAGGLVGLLGSIFSVSRHLRQV